MCSNTVNGCHESTKKVSDDTIFDLDARYYNKYDNAHTRCAANDVLQSKMKNRTMRSERHRTCKTFNKQPQHTI